MVRLTLVLFLVAAPWLAAEDRDQRLRALREEITQLERERVELERRKGGTLDELERLSAELSIGLARVREIRLREATVVEQVASHEGRIEQLDRAQADRVRYLAFRLRQMYKAGSSQTLRLLLGTDDAEVYREGLRYAAFLNARDRAVLERYRQDAVRLEQERIELVREQERLRATREERSGNNRALERSRRRQERLLEEIRGDDARRRAAITELRTAAERLTDLIDGLEPVPVVTALDMTKFQGLLDWPAEGRVRSGFGTIEHPRFKTRIPHPGLDIQAPAGDPIRAVFDGEVVYSGWMRGYGLMVVIDHGHGLHSVYGHASVLWVEPGERLERGDRLGIVGETGSFSGPSLYFELRLNGQAVDPLVWLRSR